MTHEELVKLLNELLMQGREKEWIEFKLNNKDPNEIGEYISCLGNSAALQGEQFGYLVWGIQNDTQQVAGTSFDPNHVKVGNQLIDMWLASKLRPRPDFQFFLFQFDSKPVVLLRVKALSHGPIRFEGDGYVRIGTSKTLLRDNPELERRLWQNAEIPKFESEVALNSVTADQVLTLLDYSVYFSLLGQALPDREVILEKLAKDKLIISTRGGKYNITNLGALVFGSDITKFDSVARKAVRVIVYKGNNRVETIKERSGSLGYAVGFQGLIGYLDDHLPSTEMIEKGIRKKLSSYPLLAVRELIANALIHQNLSIAGTSPLIEVFEDRIEITNPGAPLIDPLRFLDEPPQSRNETMASLMRRLNICEERGSGIDKVVSQVESLMLPAPDFKVTENHTRATLYGPKLLKNMSKEDKVRACYQHACLCNETNQRMTNSSLRKRFGIADSNYPAASSIIKDTLDAKLIKLFDPENESRRHMSYVPFWA